MSLADLLLLADGRAPVGAYAHSFGLEAAVVAGDVRDVPTLAGFAAARLATSGSVDAAFVAACCHRATGTDPHTTAASDWVHVADTEYHARIAAREIRDASRALGRHLLRLATRVWPDPALDALSAASGSGWHQPVVLGVLAGTRQLSPQDAATVAVYGLVSGIASAGVRLLGLDPVEVHGLQARLADEQHRVAARAADLAHHPLPDLPATSTPLLDVRAAHHATDTGGRLFAS